MKFIILAAGKDSNSLEKSPKCLREYNDDTVLSHQIDIYSKDNYKNIYVVGGYEILQIMTKYPQLNFSYNESWKNTQSLYSLSKIINEIDTDCLVSYSDIIHDKTIFNMINKEEINIFYDSLWENRYLNRDKSNLEKIKNDKNIDIGEYAGLLYIPHSQKQQISKLINNILKKNNLAQVSDLINSLSSLYNKNFIDVKGNWTELDSIQDVMNFTFGTKSENLFNLKNKLKKSIILDQFTFTALDFQNNEKLVIDDIQNKINSNQIVVRSSALSEDTQNSSMAGKFKSILNVDKRDKKKISEAIKIVLDSFQKDEVNNFEEKNQILIQPYLKNVDMSGVIFTKNLQTSSPYYTINYDIGDNTESVTSGSFGNLKTFICHNDFAYEIPDKKLSNLIDAIKEIESITNFDALDCEFAFINLELYILQIRPIAAVKKSTVVDQSSILNEIHCLKNFFEIDNVMLSGSKKAFGTMPDWNPAEIIGKNPKKLSFDLYKYLITDNVWSLSRSEMGYKFVDSPGMVSLGGKPYVNIQMSFNTFIPKNIPDNLCSKLIDFFIEKLQKNPENHDKVEFLTVITSYDFNFEDKIKELSDKGFSIDECSEVSLAYKDLTQKIISEETISINNELDKTINLGKKSYEILNSNLDKINKIYYLLENCKKYGTLPFSNLARCSFIGSIFLKSLLVKKLITQEEYNKFFKSINTVAKEFISDLELLKQSNLDKAKFIEKYGHLRPGTYDITSKTYSENFDNYINFDEKSNINTKQNNKFSFSKDTIEKISNELFKSELNFDVNTLLEFIKKSMEAREKSKFEFTKALSLVLDLISDLGNDYDLDLDQLSHLDLSILINQRSNSSKLNLKKEMTNNINKNKEFHLISQSIHLPELIFDTKDMESFHYTSILPNFITNHEIMANIFYLNSDKANNLKNKIVCIENADPGFDWIFSHGIKGLITKYGGVASHMSIRCAEFDLPAAIGCGDKIFNDIIKSSVVRLNCSNQTIRKIS